MLISSMWWVQIPHAVRNNNNYLRSITMGSNLAKVGSKVLATESTRDKVGMEMAKTGVTGLALWFAAGLLPFITLPMILVAMVVVGFFM
jgi:hypothetical protein